MIFSTIKKTSRRARPVGKGEEKDLRSDGEAARPPAPVELTVLLALADRNVPSGLSDLVPVAQDE